MDKSVATGKSSQENTCIRLNASTHITSQACKSGDRIHTHSAQSTHTFAVSIQRSVLISSGGAKEAAGGSLLGIWQSLNVHSSKCWNIVSQPAFMKDSCMAEGTGGDNADAGHTAINSSAALRQDGSRNDSHITLQQGFTERKIIIAWKFTHGSPKYGKKAKADSTRPQ